MAGRPLGADRQALDAARVLRVTGSRHGGADAAVEALTPVGEVWDFDDLANEVLPIEKTELFDLRVRRAAKDASRKGKRRPVPASRFSVATLQEARLSDYQRLRGLRWFEEPMPDFRDRWLFLAGVAMSWLAVPAVLQRELYALAHEVGGWSEGRSRSKMHAVFRTARESAQGRTIEWEGRRVSPLYRFKTQTILEMLEITAEEERKMSTLISSEENARRRTEKRRQAGTMRREDYRGRAAWGRAEARRMYRREKESIPEIAKSLGVSVHTVNGYVFRASHCKVRPLYGGVATPWRHRERSGHSPEGHEAPSLRQSSAHRLAASGRFGASSMRFQCIDARVVGAIDAARAAFTTAVRFPEPHTLRADTRA